MIDMDRVRTLTNEAKEMLNFAETSLEQMRYERAIRQLSWVEINAASAVQEIKDGIHEVLDNMGK